MKDELTVETFYSIVSEKDISLKAIIDEEGISWFKGCEVSKILGYNETSQPIRKFVDMKNKKRLSELKINTELNEYELLNWLDISSVNYKNLVLINESGFYELILRGKTEQAKTFKKWLTKNILPNVRINGGYTIFQEKLKSKEELEFIELQTKMLEQFEAMQELHKVCIEQKIALTKQDEILVKEYGWTNFVK